MTPTSIASGQAFKIQNGNQGDLISRRADGFDEDARVIDWKTYTRVVCCPTGKTFSLSLKTETQADEETKSSCKAQVAS